MAKEPGKRKKHPILRAVLIILVALIAFGGIKLYNAYKQYEKDNADAQVALMGTEVPDFTVKTTDGTGFNLSEALQDKEVVVLNVFATWCGPCEKEFPEFEKVYQKYSDKMVIVAVSGDEDDTLDAVADYKASHSLSFTMGIAEDNISFVPASGFPTTVIIDRNGKAVFCQSGTIPREEAFEALVTSFMGDSYEGKPVYLYTIITHTDKVYVPNVSVRLTDGDYVEEITTDENGYYFLMKNEPHVYKAEVTAAPEGYTGGTIDGEAGPSSGWITIKLKEK